MAEIRIRRHNLFTLPATIVKAAGLAAGDRFVFEIDPADPDTIVLRRIRENDRRTPSRIGSEPPGA